MQFVRGLPTLAIVSDGWKSSLMKTLPALNISTSWTCANCSQRRYLSSKSTDIKHDEEKGYSVIRTTGQVSEPRTVPQHIDKPPYCNKANRLFDLFKQQTIAEIKSQKQIEGMRDACKVAREVLDEAASVIQVGVSTDGIDDVVHKATISRGAYPSPLGYKNFPKSVCTSVNNVMCHGIPDSRSLEDGDIINVDVTVYYNGFHGDLSETYLVGDVDTEGKALVSTTRQCRDSAIQCLGPGVEFSTIGRTIQSTATLNNFLVIPEFCGHGIGEYFHGPPDIYHFENEEPGTMAEGMTFTVEPILSAGGAEFRVLDDGWTAVSVDHSRSAQFEHTVLITPHGVEILTLRSGSLSIP